MKPLELGSAADTVVGESVTLRGELQSPGNVTIDGSITGDVTAAGDVTIGRAGRVEGSVRAHNAQISGRVSGDVTVDDKCELRYSSHLRGDIACEVLEVHPGANFQGHITMRQPEAELGSEPPPEQPEA